MRMSDWSSDVCSSYRSPGSGASESAPNGFGHIFNRILLSKKHQADHCPSLGLDKFCPDERHRDAAEQRTGNRLHRPEERRVGTERVGKCSSRVSPFTSTHESTKTREAKDHNK